MNFRKRGLRAMAMGLLVTAGLALAPAAFAGGHFSVGVNVPGVSIGYGGHRGYVGVYAPAYYGAYYEPAYYGPAYYDSYYYGPSVAYYGPAYYGSYYYYGGHRYYRSGYRGGYRGGYDHGGYRGGHDGHGGSHYHH